MTRIYEGEYRLELAVAPGHLPDVRSQVSERLMVWGLGPLVDDTQSIVTELLTNVYQHTDDASAVLCLGRTPGLLHIVVSDTSYRLPERQTPDWEAQCGRGVVIIDALTAWWRVELIRTGKRVHCAVTIPGAHLLPEDQLLARCSV
ncbi:ATP-binding protein [Streptomyces sp. NPDC087850]|uniref:ATP-binding protein n=1 Tax=Streptomyces sp. NPDC087850 TaxID=3365809 RepID=UPI0038291475